MKGYLFLYNNVESFEGVSRDTLRIEFVSWFSSSQETYPGIYFVFGI